MTIGNIAYGNTPHPKRVFLNYAFILFGILIFSPTTHAFAMECKEVVYDDYYKKDKPILDKNIISTLGPILPQGAVKCHVSYEGVKEFKNYKYKIEEGIFKGYPYDIFYSDGSGSLDVDKEDYKANWIFSCKLDEIDDNHWCSVTKYSADFSVYIWKDGRVHVNVGHDHYPQSEIIIRIDKNDPFVANESGFTSSQSKDILKQLSGGEQVVTRYKEWPYESNVDTKVPLRGFNEAFEILQAIYDNIN